MIAYPHVVGSGGIPDVVFPTMPGAESNRSEDPMAYYYDGSGIPPQWLYCVNLKPRRAWATLHVGELSVVTSKQVDVTVQVLWEKGGPGLLCHSSARGPPHLSLSCRPTVAKYGIRSRSRMPYRMTRHVMVTFTDAMIHGTVTFTDDSRSRSRMVTRD